MYINKYLKREMEFGKFVKCLVLYWTLVVIFTPTRNPHDCHLWHPCGGVLNSFGSFSFPFQAIQLIIPWSFLSLSMGVICRYIFVFIWPSLPLLHALYVNIWVFLPTNSLKFWIDLVKRGNRALIYIFLLKSNLFFI